MIRTSIYGTLLWTLLLLSSCGADDDSSNSALTQEQEEVGKDLFSRWDRTDRTVFLDLSRGTFNNPRGMFLTLNTGELCRCTVEVIGNQNSGDIRISSCFYSGGGVEDPDCSLLWENNGLPYSYTKDERTLEICDAPASCARYH